MTEDVRAVARSVRQAKWNGCEVPDYRPPAETFALWVSYAKLLAASVLDPAPGGHPFDALLDELRNGEIDAGGFLYEVALLTQRALAVQSEGGERDR